MSTGGLSTSTVDSCPTTTGRRCCHFLEQAGFLHLHDVFDHDLMDAIGADIDEWIGRATPDDGESWWAETEDGEIQAVRILSYSMRSRCPCCVRRWPMSATVGSAT